MILLENFFFFLPALVLLHVCVNDVSHRQTKKTEGCLNNDPTQKIRMTLVQDNQSGAQCCEKVFVPLLICPTKFVTSTNFNITQIYPSKHETQI